MFQRPAADAVFPRLTDEQVAAYQRDGYLVVPNALTPAQVKGLSDVTHEFVEQSRSVTSHTDVYDLEPSHSAQHPLLRRIKTPEKWHPTYAEVVTYPVILGALQSLWGPAIRYQTAKLNMKVAGYGSSLEWHQDWAFYPHTNDDLAVVGVMIDDIDESNGPMLVIPGSHRGPIFDHSSGGRFVGGIDPTAVDVDFGTAAAVTGPAGSISIHHVRTLHGGAANLSGRDRRFLLLQYRSGDAWPLVENVDWDEWRASLLTGEETWTPRMEALPFRVPLPVPAHEGSIFENQRDMGHRFFEAAPAS
ncbi:MAG: phytanoyl-CoA dioxygenase family protein [Actinomycetales bacterium]|nr:phytanoyl-CoA dioxygenase family protein [Actinomycetales bacterium]